MEIRGERLIAASREAVWAALNDPETLRQCIPGCEEIAKVNDSQLAASITIKVGPIKARFSGAVTLSDLEAPSSYTISGEGSGGVAGLVRGRARVTLVDEAGQTLLSYDAHAQINGRLAQIGARLIDVFVKKTAADFFDRFGEIVSR
ncbi:CoxG family protein [Bradyrhizobium tunisiense]|uniref:CoxG family protein n=1 Tax=Bradyrhizobium tunisiense TaxID=3278709 RepID=UPI0035D6FC29